MRSAKLFGWRRVASAMWTPPNDPQIYGALEVDAEPVLAFIERARRAGHHVTPTHLAARALGHAIAKVPDLNVRIRHGRAYPRGSVDIFVITSVAGGHDLSGVKLADVPGRSAVDLATELAQRATAQKAGRDRDLAKTKRLMDVLPHRLLERALRATKYLAADLGLDLPGIGLRRQPFGSGMVTSVGMFGIPQGFAPLAWMYDVPVLILVGEIATKPVVVDGKVEARDVLPITATLDHRYVDGWHVAKAMTAFREYLAAPERFEPVFASALDEHARAN